MEPNESANGMQARVAKVAAAAGVSVEQSGSGRPVLLLHGGAGPASVAAFARDLAANHHVIVPTHPGFAGTPRAADMATVGDLARAYAGLIEGAGLRDVVVIGSSLGGWIAAEMGALKLAGLAGLVLVDAVGIDVAGEAILDVFSIPPSEIASFSFHDADRYRIDPAKLTPQQSAMMRANFAALAVYTEPRSMQDPGLRQRIADVQIPVLAVWGESDRVVRPSYGRALAAAFPRGRFALIAECGHLPQIEQPQRLLDLVRDFERTSAEAARQPA